MPDRSLLTFAVAALAVIALVRMAPAQGVPAEDRTRVLVETYGVAGSSVPELAAAVVHQAKSASTLDDGAASATISFEPSLTYEEDGLECRLGSVAVDLIAVVRLPEWITPELGDEEARRAWGRFSSYLRWHEGRHVAIAEDYRVRMELQLAALNPTPTCQTLGQQVVETVEGVKQRHLEAQTAFDASERERSLALSLGR